MPKLDDIVMVLHRLDPADKSFVSLYLPVSILWLVTYQGSTWLPPAKPPG